jgi:hypothetical protein
LKDVLDGRIEGKRPRGRPRVGMINELKEGVVRVYEEKSRR